MADDFRFPAGRSETRAGTRARPPERPLGRELEHENERAGARVRSVRGRLGRTGGAAPLPPVGASVELWSLEAKHLDAFDLSQPGWVIRCAIPTLLQPGPDETVELRGLVVQVRSIAYGTEHLIECDVSNGFALHTAGETVGGRLVWAEEPRGGPPNVFLNWTVQRGICRTTATRTFQLDVGSERSGLVPAFATHWALYSGAELAPDVDQERALLGAALEFRTYANGPRVHILGGEELLGALGGAPQRLPPYARAWAWPEGVQTDALLVFFYEGAQ